MYMYVMIVRFIYCVQFGEFGIKSIGSGLVAKLFTSGNLEMSPSSVSTNRYATWGHNLRWSTAAAQHLNNFSLELAIFLAHICTHLPFLPCAPSDIIQWSKFLYNLKSLEMTVNWSLQCDTFFLSTWPNLVIIWCPAPTDCIHWSFCLKHKPCMCSTVY